MKKAMLLLLAAVTLLGFVACPSPTGGDPVDLTSDWTIKGGYDGWTTHNFTMDELDNNTLRYEITGLYNGVNYKFVIMNAAGDPAGLFKAPNSDAMVAGTPVTFVITGTAGSQDANFTATKSSYTVEVDISDPAAPSVTLIAGATDAPNPTVAVIADKLRIKGDLFTIGWDTSTGGTLVDNGNGTGTVTFAGLTAASKTGSFGFEAIEGFLKGVSVASPTVVDTSTTPVGLLTTGDNCVITDIPNSDSVYTIVITIDEDGVTVADKYSMVVTLTSVGTTAWAFEPPVSIWLVGDLEGAAGMTNWSATDTGRAKVDLVADVATFTYTSTATETAQFKYAVAADSAWNNLVGFSGVDASTSTVAVSGVDGNIAFSSVTGNTYTIVVDFSSTFVSTGIPVLTITEATP